MAERKQVDWESVERDYSAGLLTLREIADKYGTTEGGVRYKAKQKNWIRDLSKKIEQQVENKLRKEELRSELRKENEITEREVVEANAQVIVNIKLSHRKDIARGRGLVIKLFDELEACTDNKELFDELGELLRSEDKNGQDKLNDLYHKIISMPQRIDSVKKLSESLRILIDKERQAFGIVDAPTPIDNAVSSLIKAVQGNAVTISSTPFDFDDDE